MIGYSSRPVKIFLRDLKEEGKRKCQRVVTEILKGRGFDVPSGGKDQDEVGKIITGPGVCICNECIHLCNIILNEERGILHTIDCRERDVSKTFVLPKPAEIKAYLDQHVIGQEYAKKVISGCSA